MGLVGAAFASCSNCGVELLFALLSFAAPAGALIDCEWELKHQVVQPETTKLHTERETNRLAGSMHHPASTK